MYVKSTNVTAYMYAADIYCPGCILSVALADHDPFRSVEGNLDYAAATVYGIDRDDESSYDSDDFPKPIFVDQLDGSETCGACGDEIDPAWHSYSVRVGA